MSIDIQILMDNFEDARLYKNGKKICRDSFISEYRCEFTLVNVKNGSISTRVNLTQSEAARIICHLDLEGHGDRLVRGLTTYRTEAGWQVVNKLLKDSGY